MNLSAIIERTLFWWRTRRQSRELDMALKLRRRGRRKRQTSARKGAATKFSHRMEGLKR